MVLNTCNCLAVVLPREMQESWLCLKLHLIMMKLMTKLCPIQETHYTLTMLCTRENYTGPSFYVPTTWLCLASSVFLWLISLLESSKPLEASPHFWPTWVIAALLRWHKTWTEGNYYSSSAVPTSRVTGPTEAQPCLVVAQRAGQHILEIWELIPCGVTLASQGEKGING